MQTFSADQCEQIVLASLEAVRAQFQRALEATEDRGNVFVAFDAELHVDQIRRITASSIGGPNLWMTREGKRYISTAGEVEQGLLAIHIGKNRCVTAEMLLLFCCDIVGNMQLRMDESAIATIINLVVVEPYLYPHRELPIWLTAAHALAAGQARAELHEVLPELSTDFDILYQELPEAGRITATLRPGHKRVESLPDYEMHLLEIIPADLADRIGEATTDELRTQLFASLEPSLRAYVRQHLYGKVADAVNAADGRYAVPYPPEDD